MEKLEKLLNNKETHLMGLIYGESLYLAGSIPKHTLADMLNEAFDKDSHLINLHEAYMKYGSIDEDGDITVLAYLNAKPHYLGRVYINSSSTNANRLFARFIVYKTLAKKD